MSTLMERGAATQPQPKSLLVARTNFRVPSQEARQWILTELTQSLQRSQHESVRFVEFRTTSVPTILELELHIARDTFAGAEQVAQTVVQSVKDLLDERFQASEMSTGIHPAA